MGLGVIFLIVAIVLFIVAALPPLDAYHGTLIAAGLAFFAASFLPI